MFLSTEIEKQLCVDIFPKFFPVNKNIPPLAVICSIFGALYTICTTKISMVSKSENVMLFWVQERGGTLTVTTVVFMLRIVTEEFRRPKFPRKFAIPPIKIQCTFYVTLTHRGVTRRLSVPKIDHHWCSVYISLVKFLGKFWIFSMKILE